MNQVIPDIRISIDLHQEGRDTRMRYSDPRTLLDWAKALIVFGSGRSDVRVEVDTSGVGRVTLDALRRQGVTCEEMRKQGNTVEVPAAATQLDWIAGRIADETLTDRELRETLAKGLGVIDTRSSYRRAASLVADEPVANGRIVTHGELRSILAGLRDEMIASLAKARTEAVLHDFSNINKRLAELNKHVVESVGSRLMAADERLASLECTRMTINERLLRQETRASNVASTVSVYGNRLNAHDEKLSTLERGPKAQLEPRVSALERMASDQSIKTGAVERLVPELERRLVNFERAERARVAQAQAQPTGMRALALHELEQGLRVLGSRVADLARPLATARIATLERRVHILGEHTATRYRNDWQSA